MRGKVYKSTGSWYVVKSASGEVWNARLKGILKLDGITSTNPIAVGDEVEMEAENGDEHTATISEIYDRRNYIDRQSPSHRMQHHIVAANLDQSLLIATLKEPRTSQGFIDRFLVGCEMYHVPAIVVFNKADLYRQKEEDKFALWREMYEAVGYRVIRMSVQTGEGVDEMRATLHGRISLLSGHSGVGKSSFLNAIFPGLGQKTQGLSGWSGKGIHTTTFAEMFDLPGGEGVPDGRDGVDVPEGAGGGRAGDADKTGARVAGVTGSVKDGEGAGLNGARGGSSGPGSIIDTPGMREFGLVNITRAELSGYFPEMRALAGECQFNNCLHAEEPGCVVKEGVREGRIAEDRYVSYRSILDSIDVKNY